MSNRILKVTTTFLVGLVSVFLLPGPAHAQPDTTDCAAYVGAAAWCVPGVPDYDCDQIPIEHRPIDLVNPANDPFRLDADNDGIGCEIVDGTSPDQEDTDVGDMADGGTLPETGSERLVLGGLGTGVLVLGLLLFALGRRRRITFLTS